jgi:hypothetical protein
MYIYYVSPTSFGVTFSIIRENLYALYLKQHAIMHENAQNRKLKNMLLST